MLDYNKDKVDDAVLALLCLTMWDDATGTHTWKSFDWAAMNRLHERGYISNPKSTAKSVAVTDEGRAKARELFLRLFGKTG